MVQDVGAWKRTWRANGTAHSTHLGCVRLVRAQNSFGTWYAFGVRAPGTGAKQLWYGYAAEGRFCVQFRTEDRWGFKFKNNMIHPLDWSWHTLQDPYMQTQGCVDGSKGD